MMTADRPQKTLCSSLCGNKHIMASVLLTVPRALFFLVAPPTLSACQPPGVRVDTVMVSVRGGDKGHVPVQPARRSQRDRVIFQ